MNLPQLDNLVKIGQIKSEPRNKAEFDGLLHSAKARFKDAQNELLCFESRFDLAYNAAHSLALAALRFHGYRSTNRFIVFQVLPHTTGLGPNVWRIFSKCHEKRNIAEYEGGYDIEEHLLTDLISATKTLMDKVNNL